jgi:hypothetical protein
MLVITRVSWERALVKYCSGEGDLVGEARELKTLGYPELSTATRYRTLVPVYFATAVSTFIRAWWQGKTLSQYTSHEGCRV